MRIAISGTHRTGKSTLVAALAASLPTYKTVDEPYCSMEEDGHEFSQPPSLEDFEAQLERSIADLNESGSDVLFDRCPLDILGYLLAHADADAFEQDAWLPSVKEAVQTLDLVVFVPIEHPDRIRVARSHDEGTPRAVVDEALQEILLDDSLQLGVETLTVEGDIEARVRSVLRRIGVA